MIVQSAADFWASPAPVFDEPAPEDDGIPRDQYGRPKILLPDGSGKYRSYDRASSFGKQIEYTGALDAYNERQVARGMAIRLLESRGTLPLPKLDKPETRAEKAAWDAQVIDCHEAAGSNEMSRLGTAIHAGTELVDRGEPIGHLHPLVQERALAYWRFTRAEGIRPTSVEVFGVDDVHRVAGTWDRTGWYRRKHKIVDVKTSGTMDYAGIGFAVQLAEYAHMSAYDKDTGLRTPHEVMDMQEGLIIHVSREEGGPIELYSVDITVGWEWAVLVHQIKKARREGRHAIQAMHAPDAVTAQIVAAASLDELGAVWRSRPRWPDHLRELFRTAAVDLKQLTALAGSH